MPRCLRGPRGPVEAEPVPEKLKDFWCGLALSDRQRLLTVDRKALFQRIRAQYCSRCYGLFAMRYDELQGSASLDCPACMEFYSGLVVSGSQLTLEPKLVHAEPGPFAAFAETRIREREREMQFMTGDICGSGWQRRPGVNVCALHSQTIPADAIAEYWAGLPDDHRSALFRLREEDFCAELDAHLKYHLRICRDCRGNVLRAFKDLKPVAKKGADAVEATPLEVCEGHCLRVEAGMVCVDSTGSAAAFFDRAEEVEESKACESAELGDEYDHPDHVRHAETPELAREALIDSIVLIYKSQVEVAFREQTAGHNALLLFVHLTLSMMEQQVLNEYKDLEVRQAEAELLDLVAKEQEEKKPRKAKRKVKKGLKSAAGTSEDGCSECAALQSGSGPSSPRTPLSPRSLSPAQRSPSPHTHRQPSPPCMRTASHQGLSGRHAMPTMSPRPDAGGWEVQSGKGRRGSGGSSLAVGGRRGSLGPEPPSTPPALEQQLQVHAGVQLPVLHRPHRAPPRAPWAALTAAAAAAHHQQEACQEQNDPEWTPLGGRKVGPGFLSPGQPVVGAANGKAGLDDMASAQASFSLFHHSPASPSRKIKSAGLVEVHHDGRQATLLHGRVYGRVRDLGSV
ncbi:hypothetical protein WJX73_010583 [Symbiochloris irregularis]|uniref:Uncharacterized protein n=1 Tax=Symbiochloris irregularis TaxID=706552 RepID=A0AAW1PDU7_9CHLO